MLYLPYNTPNYILYLETGLNTLYLDTLKLHFSYINRVLHLPVHRLPRLLAEKIISMNTFWAEEWGTICERINFVPENTAKPLCDYWKPILQLLKTTERDDHISNARRSQFHDLYSQLNYGTNPIYTSVFSSHATSLIIKARGGLLDINGRAFRRSTVGLCTLCNMDESENTLHFIGVCPIFNEFRVKYFGKNILNINEVLNILNSNYYYYSLFKYLEICSKYRKLILNEFN